MKMLLVLAVLAACNDTQARPAGNVKVDSDGVAPSASAAAAQTPVRVRLEQVGEKFRSPVHLTSPAGDSRLFVVEQAGRIRVIRNGSVLPQPFLDIASRVRSGGEQGLLSVAFDPNYRSNGYFYVNFTDRSGDTRIERFKVSSNADVADPQSSKLVLGIDQPYSNHNGGLVMFGPDGMLYIGMGDGGSGGDPHRNGQSRQTLLGKMLRIDVSSDPYRIPPDNPYANGSGGKREIWAIGMRNPWRFSFDRANGLLYIADVGQNEFEEVNVAPANRAGLNYGWNIMEANKCFRATTCDRTGLEIPAVTFNHSGGACSVTGGHVYRGRKIPAIAGHYFYSDYCAGWLRSFRYQNGKPVDAREWKMDDIGHVVSFGEDSAGELYILSESGKVYRIAGVS
jgi:glucose/arabinose dehydrogenase